MTTTEETKSKLQQVLQLFLSPDYKVALPTYLDVLLTHITEKVKSGNKAIYQILCNWIVQALNTWNENFKPCQSRAAFTIKLMGLVSSQEVTFMNLVQNNIFSKAWDIFEFQSKDLPASLKMAFVVMLMDLVEHQSGRNWIAQTGAWKEVLRFSQVNHTLYVTRESRKFLAVLLLKECDNKNLCSEIILTITEPIISITNDCQSNNHNLNLNKDALANQHNLLLATTELLLVILDYVTFHDLDNPIFFMFEELTSLENRVKLVFEVSISTPLVKTVLHLIKLLHFAKLRDSIRVTLNKQIDEKSYEQFCLKFCYTATLLMSKKYILDFVVSQKLVMIYWKKLNKLKPIEIKPPNRYKFEMQVIALMMLPLCVTMKPKSGNQHYLFEQFIDKLFELTCTPVQRLCYNVRDVLLKNDLPMENICKSTVDHMVELVDVMTREEAVLVFQMLCHTLKNFVYDNNSENEESSANMRSPSSLHRKRFRYFLAGDPIVDKPILLASLLNALNIITEKFKLKWQECVETICVLSIAQDILNHANVQMKIVMLALKTCKLAIENFMPPNLALLVDFDEQTREIGPTFFKRIHHQSWEVQDSVLEILKTIACLSEKKYPPYQCLLLENQFLQVAVELVKSESEIYVRASALSFIATAVRINVLWEKLLCQLNLVELAMNLIYNESEALVRREAVAVLTELYEHRSWPKTTISAMSQAMTVAAVLDLHWEVKVNALEFWNVFIKSHLTDQGMLDGHFPSVTFSKEHRKIVSLDAVEIKKRLNKALDELARQFCLGVLLVCLKDESDLEVARTSARVISELRRLLLEYKIDEPMPTWPSPKDSATIDVNYVKRSPPRPCDGTEGQSSNYVENIIKEIVDADDTNLLASIYSESMKMDGDTPEGRGKETLERVGRVNREEFLRTILNFDFDAYLDQRTQWLQSHTSSFDSVLDDIIVSSQSDINVLDCY